MSHSYTTSTAFLEALQEAGVSYLFSNLGSDHPGIIESLAAAKQEGKPLPKVITCPHEMVALSIAHSYAQVTGEPQAVLVHVECGTQNLGGALHNAYKGRVPVLIFAGASPYTQEGELPGSRNEFIHWIQDVPDQRGIVRGYMKYDNEIRTGANVKQLVHRALQISKSQPKGPVYLMGPREVMEEETEPAAVQADKWKPVSPAAMPPEEVDKVVHVLKTAENPVVVTSYLGKNTEAVKELVQFSETYAVPVIESVSNYMNFPADHPMHCGYQWNEPSQHELLEKADVVLVFDSDVPWIPTKNKPSDTSTIYYFDEEPLKESMPLWYVSAEEMYQVDAKTALSQLNKRLIESGIDEGVIAKRWERITRYHQQLCKERDEKEVYQENVITPEYLTACIREAIDDDTIVVNEGISNFDTIYRHLQRTKPGSIIGSGGGSLGWNGGASLGVKLSAKDKKVVNLTGDGSYMFSVPSTVHWMSRKYDLPFLTVIYNNRGWKSPKLSTLGVHPQGTAYQTDNYWVDFEPHADLAGIAQASGGAFAKTVKDPKDVKEALKEAMAAVEEGRSAVLDVYLPAIKEEEKSQKHTYVHGL
ncbi:acetolactate synthase-1/2/3 large subunit [Alteribacillus persepolensis]|uniref:Acetolactate synthase-1/2/3 large subunit n=1 Tax=Alteribacillus persepolensis TaxID=568899 RepID=A0A1G8A5P1_9BACI|nr:thiamine pyrophosphate-requiring protein [Alteribacillus persepolensis]SDH16248.1 acetolactate synthase-1/2/3 large subunit [Alteribacillus persepolensis]